MNYRVKKSDALSRTKPVLLLIDTNNILWRTSFVAIKDYNNEMVELRQKKVKTKQDEERYDMLYNEFIHIWKNIVYSMLRRIVHTHKPNKVLLCRDAGQTWRLNFFKYYKGERRVTAKKADKTKPYSMSEFYKEIDKIIVELNSILHYQEMLCPYMEADDIIAVISQTLNDEYDIIISSTDKDFAQLITDDGTVKFWEHHKKVFLSQDDKQTFDEMILLGDKSDGIPRMFDADDSIVMFDEDDPSKMILSPSYMRPRFGVKKAQKIIAENKRIGITLSEYAKANNVYAHYIRNKILFSLNINDFKKYNSDIIDIIMQSFYNLKITNQSFIEMQKYFAKRRLNEQLDHLEEFMLPKFKKD